MQFYEELKRRNVIRVGIAYLVAAWLIIQVTETLFPVYGLSDDAIRLVVTVLAIGLAPTLVLAWIYERTSEGIKRQKDVDRTQSITTDTGRKLDRAIIVVLVLALGYFAFDKFVVRPPATGPAVVDGASPALAGWNNREVARERRAIAVLPFANMSGDPGNEPFTLGIHDDLLTHLSRIGALKTTSRTSVLQYRDTTKSVPEIGAELGVDFILEGGIQRAGDRVRINLQLIDVATDEHLWAEIYDRQLTAENLFAVQADVAGEVSRSLQATLLPEEQAALDDAPTRSMAAYDLFLLGRHHQQTRTAESLNRAVDYYTRAIEEDPDYVLAYAGLAQSRLLLIGYGNLSGAEVIPEAEELVERALALDDTEAAVWATRGLTDYQAGRNLEAIEAFERAIELDIQNYQAWLWYANSLNTARRHDEHLEALEVAYSLEPMSQPVNNNLAYAYRNRGDFVRARQHFERADQIDDINPTQWKELVADTYYRSGDLDRTVIAGREILALDPGNSDVMRMLINSYVELGDLAEARRWVEESEKINAFSGPAYWLYIARDDFDGLLAYLEDKRAMVQADGNEYLYDLFLAAYLGRQTETARMYINRWLSDRGGRMEVNPAGTWHWDTFAVADFLIHHGDQSPGGARRGREMVEEATRGLMSLSEAGFEHPNTWFGLAMGHALSGDRAAALAALDRAVESGFSSRLRLDLYPALDSLRDDPAFIAIGERMDARLAEEGAQLAGAPLAAYEPIGVRERIVLPRDMLQSYAGHYTDGNMLFHIFLDDSGELMGQPGNQMAMALVPYAEGAFYVERAASIFVSFFNDADGVVTHIEVNDGGGVQRLKAVDSPPPAADLDEEALAAFTGSWAAERVQGASGGTADTDIWAAEIYVDDDGQAWIDFDDQPRLAITPIAEDAFIVAGFVQRYRFESSDPDGTFDRLVMDMDGTELVFERQ